MWWRKTKPNRVAPINGTFGQMAALVVAENEGRKAWRICVVNAMLAEEFRRPGGRRYRWNVSELSQLSGVTIEKMCDHDAREDDRP